MHKLLFSFLILGMTLVGCGSGSSTSNQSNAATPVGAFIKTDDFVALTNDPNCANRLNRLFVIDAKYVLWDSDGKCADAAYTQTLYGVTPQNILCTNGDSFAGPRSSCTDQQYANLFQTILDNVDKSDLGLGSAHKVVQVPTPQRSILAHAPLGQFLSLRPHLHYGAPPSNIVIRDQKTWVNFLNETRITTSDFGDGLTVDFSKQMVLGVFFKTPNNCSSIKILNLRPNVEKKVVAEYLSEERISLRSCDTSSTLSSTPMNLVVTDRFDAPIEFVDVSATRVNVTPLVQTNTPSYSFSRNYFKPPGNVPSILREEFFWTYMKANVPWKSVFAQAPFVSISTRSIDFSKRMLIGEFVGIFRSNCYQMGDIYVWRSNNNLNVAKSISFPVSNSVCTLQTSVPTYLIEFDRSDDTVVISTIPNAL